MESTVKRRAPSARHWNVTVQIPLEQARPMQEALFKSISFTYAVFGRETAPTTGKKHLQGYVAMKKQTTLVSMKKFFPGAHLEICRGTPAQNKVYCTKVYNNL